VIVIAVGVVRFRQAVETVVDVIDGHGSGGDLRWRGGGSERLGSLQGWRDVIDFQVTVISHMTVT
jgi:hypothetical protein